MIPSTKKQRQLIGIACNQLGIDKPVKADMLLERFGKSSTTDISKADAEEFLGELKSKGFRFKRGRSKRQTIPRAGGNTVSMVSKKELEKISALSGLIHWRKENGLARWMHARLGIEKIRTGGDAYRVIEGLKKMFENGMKKKHGPDWWVGLYEDPETERYIQEHCPIEYWRSMLWARLKAGVISNEAYQNLILARS